MEKWQYISLSDGMGGGITEEGYQFIEIDIDAWNDDEDWSDLEKLASVRATNLEDRIEVTIHSKHENIADNPRIIELIKEAVEVLQEEAKVHFSE